MLAQAPAASGSAAVPSAEAQGALVAPESSAEALKRGSLAGRRLRQPRRAPPLLAALLLCGARGVSATAYPGAAAATQLAASIAAASIAAGPLARRPLRAGLINVLPPGQPAQLGVDGFSRLVSVDSLAAAAGACRLACQCSRGRALR